MEDVRKRRGADIASDHHLVVAKMKVKLKKHWVTEETELQMSNTTFLRDTDKLNEFKIALNNRFHDTTKKLAGKYSKPERPVKDKEGKPITEIQQQRNRWVECFEELLNRPAPMNPPDIEAAHTDLPIDVNPPTKEEIRMAVIQIKNGKAAGPDNIPAEALKPNCNTTDHRRTIS
ncbi:unnamed protein product [Schistosoma margrebowiei]|uniref:Uncharacterized protein n=1 Tax=Schistosoma margrebowiei TaxID=48269 RepID=A0A183LA48_9TREM|nr:unnamed protein product [Schistosoma margrebowiei]